MTHYNEQEYEERMKRRGTQAERQFKIYANRKGWNGGKYGFEQGIPKFWKVPEVIRATPDFIISHPKPMLVEVKGCGEDGILKLKFRDLGALGAWNDLCEVWMFFYDSHRNRVSFQGYESILDILDSPEVEIDEYPDNKAKFHMLPVNIIKWENIE